MVDGQLYDLIHDLIVMETKRTERPDSIEFGPASNRKKVYVNVADIAKAKELVQNMKDLGAFAESQ